MEHFERLITMYRQAPIHEFYENIRMQLEPGLCSISLPIDRRYFHAAMAAHGSVYFKLLDDACYFACQTKITDFFLVTTHFEIDLRRPIQEGEVIARGEFLSETDGKYMAQATLINSEGKVCGTGKGVFVKSRTALTDVKMYIS